MRIERAERTVHWLALIGLVECVVLAIVSWTFDSRPLAFTVGVLSLLVTLLILATMISPMAVAAPGYRTFFRQPFTPLFESLDDAMGLDLDTVSELMGCEREAVEYVLAHFKNERFAFERRGMMLAGSLDRLGFFPTMIAFTRLIVPVWTHLHPRVRSFALLVPAFLPARRLRGSPTWRVDDLSVCRCWIVFAGRDRPLTGGTSLSDCHIVGISRYGKAQ